MRQKLATPAPVPDNESGEDTDLENLLEHLDAEGMQGDPDIKKEKQQMSQKRHKKKMQSLMKKGQKSLELKGLKKELGQQ